MSPTLIFENDFLSIRDFIAEASAFFVILESGKAEPPSL